MHYHDFNWLSFAVVPSNNQIYASTLDLKHRKI